LVNSKLGRQSASLDGALFVLRAPYGRWKDVIRQELDPLKGVLQGKITIRGHLPVILEWTKPILVLVELAGRIDTAFVDELAPTSRSRAPGDGA
jgi:putative sterol carrier protein